MTVCVCGGGTYLSACSRRKIVFLDRIYQSNSSCSRVGCRVLLGLCKTRPRGEQPGSRPAGAQGRVRAGRARPRRRVPEAEAAFLAPPLARPRAPAWGDAAPQRPRHLPARRSAPPRTCARINGGLCPRSGGCRVSASPAPPRGLAPPAEGPREGRGAGCARSPRPLEGGSSHGSGVPAGGGQPRGGPGGPRPRRAGLGRRGALSGRFRPRLPPARLSGKPIGWLSPSRRRPRPSTPSPWLAFPEGEWQFSPPPPAPPHLPPPAPLARRPGRPHLSCRPPAWPALRTWGAVLRVRPTRGPASLASGSFLAAAIGEELRLCRLCPLPAASSCHAPRFWFTWWFPDPSIPEQTRGGGRVTEPASQRRWSGQLFQRQ